MGCAVADIDNDGRPDIVLTGYGIVPLFHSEGSGKLKDITRLRHGITQSFPMELLRGLR
jgi:hypothetical protein